VGPRTGTPVDFLVVGLGNPGTEFEGTRHNAGAQVVALLVERHGGRLKSEKGLQSLASDIRIGGKRVLTAVPLTFMNESGLAVAPLVRRSGIDEVTADPAEDRDAGADGADGADSADQGSEAGQVAKPAKKHTPPGTASRLIVVHDELDLPSGRLKVKSGGGTAGNNGLKSINSHLHTNEYLRVRVGIGKPPGRQPGADYVLRRPGAAERATLTQAFEEAADAVETIVTQGVDAAMSRFNGAGG
jgi:peptidyl-tRNA hydrolase, PTH1 family